MFELALPALLMGVALALTTGWLGSFLLWRRMAYFGDTLAHSSLLGIAIGVITGTVDYAAHFWILLVCVLIGLGILRLQRHSRLSLDTLLTIIGQSALALGVVLISLVPTVRGELTGYLFGDILATTRLDVGIAWGLLLVVSLVMRHYWRRLVAITVHEDLARVEGVAVERISLIYMVLVAITVAVAIKLIGVLLLTALLVIPAATARQFAYTPERMVLYAMLVGVVAVIGGLGVSFGIDTPTGPSIVLTATLCFIVVQAIRYRASA